MEETMSSDTLVRCPCGDYHPFGFVCEKAQHSSKHLADRHEHSRHDHADTCCDHAHEHTHDHAHGDCCGHEHAAPQSIDWGTLGEASATRAIYRIVNMDCPMEEALIRKKLATVPGITGLEFNLMQRVLTVNHELPSTDAIEAALKAIDMAPEPLAVAKGVEATFLITGMDCPEEEGLIRGKLAGMPGVFALDFNLMQRVLKVRHEPWALPAISAALASLNMDARLLDAQSEDISAIPAPKIPWKKLAVAGIFAALSEGAELIHEWGAKPFGLDMSAWTLGGYPVLEYLPLLFAVIAIALGGLTTYRKGWLAVSNLNLNINALMSVAVTGAVLIGQFPEAAMVMVLFNISEAIEAKALDRARNAIKNLLALAPDTATVLREDGSWREMDIREVAVGSRVRVKPGEKIALDGLVVSGHSMVNQAPITGESMPVEKKAGDTVYAGTINESGSFEFDVTAAATNSTLARIIHAVEEAQGSRAPMQRFVDAFARYYTPAVFLVSILSAIIPPLFLGGAWMESIYTALVVLVIGCPCALVISTPVSIVSGMAAATRYGILIKGGMFLEQGRLLNWLALDKTGTITYGKPRQTDFILTGQESEKRARTFAASLAARSDHPVSKAIAQAATESGIQPLPVENFTALPGQGTSGIIDGKKWFMGNHRMVESLQLCSEQLEKQIFHLEKQGKTVVALMSENGVQCLLAVADTVKESSLEALREMKKLGVKTVMLTGDNEHTAQVIAAQVGVDEFRANLLPEDKLAVIEQLEQQGEKVGMVGDGINDAPALAKAHVGFAMAGGGTDTAIETADVALMDDDLRKIPRFIRLSRSTYAILVQNISLALGVKALFFALTFTGNATMWMAVFADVGTALLVVANGLRAMRK
ncbi:heavy metal translocating P-type ATPase [uncultured Desulfovibrio sp.]|uniref:heavy metal translocating P-type ATPase n=1 Tax=uncultured Desulfovibrio sp. TaxID=167968 RepID=UPI00266F4D37|nr:heavy metal translocating P-type ATPase [uncultured Desulfovibrio sp.]